MKWILAGLTVVAAISWAAAGRRDDRGTVAPSAPRAVAARSIVDAPRERERWFTSSDQVPSVEELCADAQFNASQRAVTPAERDSLEATLARLRSALADTEAKHRAAEEAAVQARIARREYEPYTSVEQLDRRPGDRIVAMRWTKELGEIVLHIPDEEVPELAAWHESARLAREDCLLTLRSVLENDTGE